MEALEARTLFSFLSTRTSIAPVRSVSRVRGDAGLKVSSYAELVERVAELSFRNPQFALLFRGQGADWRNRARNSSIKPTLFRSPRGTIQLPGPATLMARYRCLEAAEELLVAGYQRRGFIGLERLQRYRILRWTILQHYEVCETPLLDATHSLRVAASFASQSGHREVFVLVLAVPQVGGSVTASAEHGVQVIRLSSICPPEALRPHFQEGYLLGEYPELFSLRDKKHYAHYEIDFGLRLLAKFRFEPGTFWKDPHFPQIDRAALYPDPRDRFWEFTETIRQALARRSVH